MTKRKQYRIGEFKQYGAICHPGGRTIEITSKHDEWLTWAQNALYAAAEAEQRQRDNEDTCSDCGVGAGEHADDCPRL